MNRSNFTGFFAALVVLAVLFAGFLLFSGVPQRRNNKLADPKDIHSVSIPLSSVFEDKEAYPFPTGVGLQLVSVVNLDTKNHSVFYDAHRIICVEMSMDDPLVRSLKSGSVYKITYQILGIDELSGSSLNMKIPLRCIKFEEVPTTPAH